MENNEINENYLYRLESKYTKDALTALLKKTAHHLSTYLIIILDIIVIAALLYLAISGYNKISIYIFASAYVLFSIFILIFSLIQNKTRIKKFIEINGEIEIEFLIFEDHIETFSNSLNGKSHLIHSYDKYNKILEDDNYLFLCTKDRQAHIIDKKNISENDLNSLKEFLKIKINK